MKETVLDVLIFLFDNYLNAEIELVGDEDDIADELEQAGFEEQDVFKALNWLGALSELYHENFQVRESKAALRNLTRYEREKLDVQAQGYFIKLQNQGILDSTTREIILESVMAIDVQNLNLGQFKRIVGMVMLNNPKAESLVACGEDLIYREAGGLTH